MNKCKVLACLVLLIMIRTINGSAQCISGNCNDGKGVKMYPDSSRFEGVFKKGQRSEGLYKYASGDVYEGSFEKNQRHGYGRYTYKDGSWFDGIFNMDKKEYGRYKYKNGDEYVGSFVENKPDGFGIMRMASGRVIEGTWEAGKPVWEAPNDSISLVVDTTATKTYLVEDGEKVIRPKMFAVVVGVADYQGTRADLKYSDDDARIFYQHLKRAFSREIADGQATLLLDNQASKTAVLSALRNSFSRAGENDYIIFFFSGHGAKGLFCPYDLDNNYLYHSEIKEIFKGSKAKYRLCIADACHAGSIGASNIASSNTYDAVQNLRDSRLAVILSSTTEQTSVESGQYGQGLFSYWLMNGIRGAADMNNDKYITAGELFVYTRKAVERKSGGAQIPVVIGQQLDKIPLCRLR